MSDEYTLLSVIVGGIFALAGTYLGFRQYDLILRNQQRFHANKIIFEHKDNSLRSIYMNLKKLRAIIVLEYQITSKTHQMSFDNVSREQLIDIWSAITVLEITIKEKIIPQEIHDKFLKWCFYNKDIEQEDLANTITGIGNILIPLPTIWIQKVDNDLINIELYLKEEKISSNLMKTITYIITTSKEFAIKFLHRRANPTEVSAFAENFDKKLKILKNQFKRELDETVEELMMSSQSTKLF